EAMGREDRRGVAPAGKGVRRGLGAADRPRGPRGPLERSAHRPRCRVVGRSTVGAYGSGGFPASRNGPGDCRGWPLRPSRRRPARAGRIELRDLPCGPGAGRHRLLRAVATSRRRTRPGRALVRPLPEARDLRPSSYRERGRNRRNLSRGRVTAPVPSSADAGPADLALHSGARRERADRRSAGPGARARDILGTLLAGKSPGPARRPFAPREAGILAGRAPALPAPPQAFVRGGDAPAAFGTLRGVDADRRGTHRCPRLEDSGCRGRRDPAGAALRAHDVLARRGEVPQAADVFHLGEPDAQMAGRTLREDFGSLPAHRYRGPGARPAPGDPPDLPVPGNRGRAHRTDRGGSSGRHGDRGLAGTGGVEPSLQVEREVSDRLLEPSQDGKRDVVDGNAASGSASQGSAMRVAMEDGRRPQLVDGPRQTRRSEEGKDLERLSLEGRPARGVVEQADADARAELEERVLELQFLGEAGRFRGGAVGRKVAGEKQALRFRIDACEGDTDVLARVGSAVEIANGCDAHGSSSVPFYRTGAALHRIGLVSGPPSHLAIARVEIAVFLELVHVLLARKQGPPAKALGGRGPLLEGKLTGEQILHHRDRKSVV